MKERFVEYCDGNRIEVDVLEKYHFKEGTVNDGYVIEDDLGNQLLRIPSGYTADGVYVRGFWISRYEISVDDEGNPHSIAGEYPCVGINFFDAKKKAKEMNGVLIANEEYNRIAMWLVQTGAATFEEVFIKGNKDIGNYSKPFVVEKTASNPKWMRNRLDCFWGGAYIWTTEKSELYDHHRIIRGGHNSYFTTGEKHPPAFRAWADPERDSENITFRIVVRDPKKD